jgi:hypothetical protein
VDLAFFPEKRKFPTKDQAGKFVEFTGIHGLLEVSDPLDVTLVS